MKYDYSMSCAAAAVVPVPKVLRLLRKVPHESRQISKGWDAKRLAEPEEELTDSVGPLTIYVCTHVYC